MARISFIFSLMLVCVVIQGEEVEKNCLLSWQEFQLSLQRNEVWSSRIIDSTANIPSGLLDGNVKALGNFDECMGVRAQKVFQGKDVRIFGKYCLVSGTVDNIEQLKEVTLKVAICIPHFCTAKDMNTLIETNRFPLASTFASTVKLDLNFTDKFCQTEADPHALEAGDYAAIGLYTLAILLVLASTIYDVILHYQEKLPASDALIAFSALSNGRKLCSVTNQTNQLNCLHGIRSISMMWIILGHSYSTKVLGALSNSVAVFNWYQRPMSMYMLGASVAVDSFFLLSGIVLAYVFMQDKTKGHWLIKIPFTYLHRYIRLTPVLAAVLICHITILKYMGQGPLWPISDEYLIDNCKNYWWSVLIYLQNYINGNEQCVGQSWYLSVDMQLFILSPLILYPLKAFPKFGISIIIFLICASMGGTFYIAWYYKLSGLLSGQDLVSIKKYYIVTHTRAPPYLIGIIIGYFIYKAKFSYINFKMNKALVALLWCASLIVLFLCVFSGQNLLIDTLVNNVYHRGLNAAYMTFVRPSWAIALAWVIFACVTGYGGPIDAFLSLPIFQILSRFTYTLYLSHYTMLSVLTLCQKEPIHFTDTAVMFEFWANYMFAFAIAVGLTLTFESPIIALEKCISGKKKEPPYTDTGNSEYSIPRVQVESIYSQVLKNMHSK